MILGNICTRSCRFCGVPKGQPTGVDEDEPRRLAEAVRGTETAHGITFAVLGRVLLDLGLFKAAADVCRRGIEVEAGEPETYLVLGQALLALGERGKALDAIRDAEDNAPGFRREPFDCADRIAAAINAGPIDAEYRPGTRVDPKGIGRIVFLCFYGRSGSSFLISLLEGHPDILTQECHLRYFFNLNTIGRKLLSARNALEQLGMILNFYDPPPDNTGPPIRFLQDGWTKGVCRYRFVSAFLESVAENFGPPRRSHLGLKDLFCLLHTAYSEASGRAFASENPLIVYHHHLWETNSAGTIAELFSDARFLQMIRSPIQTLGSHFNRYRSEKDYPVPRITSYVLRMLFEYESPMAESLRGRSAVTRLEDLHNHPRETMTALASWLGIPFDETLMTTGMVWKTGDRVVKGFDPDNVKDKHFELYTIIDKIILYRLLEKNHRLWGYAVPWWGRLPVPDFLIHALILLPMQMERLTWRDAGLGSPWDAERRESYRETRKILLKRLKAVGEGATRPVDRVIRPF